MSIKLEISGLQLQRWVAYNRRDGWPGFAEIHNELLSEMDIAEEFISNSDETIQSLLTNPIKWRNYKELNYVNRMDSFF